MSTARIEVDRLEVLKTGKHPRTGREWTLYAAHLSTPVEIDGKDYDAIRTFDPLVAGAQDVEVEIDPRYGEPLVLRTARGQQVSSEDELAKTIRKVGELHGLSWEPDCSAATMLGKLSNRITLLERTLDAVTRALEARHDA